MDIESGAGGVELLDHKRVALKRGPDERSVPNEKSNPSAVGSDSARPIYSAQGPYPLQFWASRAAPAAMSCSTTSVWPFIAAKMSAVYLPRSQLQG